MKLALVVFPTESVATVALHRRRLRRVLDVLADEVLDLGPWGDEGGPDGEVRFRRRTLPEKALDYPLRALRIARALVRSRRRFDVAVFYLALPFLAPAAVACRLVGKPLVVVIGSRSPPPVPEPRRQWNRFLYVLLRGLEFVVLATSSLIITEGPSAVEGLGLDRWRSRVYPRGWLYVDLDRFHPHLPVAKRDNAVGFVGRLSWDKGILELVSASAGFQGPGEGPELVVVGDGPLQDEVQKTGASAGALIRHFPHVPNDDLPSILGGLRLLVIPSRFEAGTTVVLLEAMATGTPVLASRVGAIHDFVRDGENGFLLPDLSPASLAATVRRCLGDPKALDLVARMGRLTAEELFDFEGCARRYGEALGSLKPKGGRMNRG